MRLQHFSGRPVLVTFIVQVPPVTPFTSYVYITTDTSGWNAQAIPMDRMDALHYQITRRFNSGTIFRYIYDRGSFQSAEIAQNGLQRTPRRPGRNRRRRARHPRYRGWRGTIKRWSQSSTAADYADAV